MEEVVRRCQICHKTAVVDCKEDVSSSMCGWIVLSMIHPCDNYDCFTFCSIDCLKTWINTQTASVPDVFEMSFKEGE